MSSLYRGPSKDVSYQVSVHFAKQFQRRRFWKIGQSETIIAYGGHVCWWIGTKLAFFIEDLPWMLPTKFRFIWPSGFRGEDFFKSANQKQELTMAAMFVNGSGQNERTFHRCFLPSFTSFSWGVSEKIKMWKVNGRQTDAKWWQKPSIIHGKEGLFIYCSLICIFYEMWCLVHLTTTNRTNPCPSVTQIFHNS